VSQTNVRDERSDKKMRLYPYVDKSTTGKNLKMLQVALSTQVDISVHDIAEEILEVVSKSPDFINWIQDKYKVPKDHPFRVMPIHVNGKVAYLKHFFES